MTLIALAAGHSAEMDPATKERCRAATALVRPERGGWGASFCVHGSGLFLASQHVLGNSDSVPLFLNPGTARERLVQGRVIQRDRQLDLVLILAEEFGGEYTALQLGDAADLAAFTEITAFGFPDPPGTPQNPGNPTLAADGGRLTALQTEDGRIVRLETDAVLHTGNSGGALVNRQGLVLGLVAAGVPGESLSYALPVNRIRKFLTNAVIHFEPLPILDSEMDLPADFGCRVFLMEEPQSSAFAVQLTLRPETGAARAVELRRAGRNAYRASVPPGAPGERAVCGAEQALRYRLAVTREGKAVGLREGAIPLVSFERSLVSRLTFSEGAGRQAWDSSGRGNHGTLAGTAMRIRDVSDGVLELDGANDVLEFPAGPDGMAGPSRSLLLRLRATAGGIKGIWLESGMARAMEDSMRQGLFPFWPEAWGTVVAEPLRMARGCPLKNGEWHEVVLVSDPEAGKASYFVDGALWVEGMLEGASRPAPTLQLGRMFTGSGTTAAFRGQLDEVRLYDRALSQGEIRLLWQKGCGAGAAP